MRSFLPPLQTLKNPRSFDPLTIGLSLGLLLLSLGAIGGVGWMFWQRQKTHYLVLAAGGKTGESYILAQAIKQVVEAQLPHIKIDVQESKGTAENIERIEKGTANLATAQADLPAGPKARTVAVLYADSFQLIVQGQSSIQKFTDLKGKNIGMVTRGGQYESFMNVARHFGLSHKDFEFIGENDQIIDIAFQQQQVDAIFQVRAIGNQRVATLIKSFDGRLVPIEQAEALKLEHPAFESAKIPIGAYKGSQPQVPQSELPTIAVQRLLLASATVDANILRQITQLLNEQRRELKAAIPAELGNTSPLIANIRRPELTGGTGIPLHPGAAAYYDRNEPSFIQKNSDMIALGLTVGALIWSWIAELKNWVDRRQKNLADTYIQQVMAVASERKNNHLSREDAQAKMDEIFAAMAAALVQEEVTQESFQTFNDIYRTMRSVATA
jgi:uncharacterized protein